MMKKIIAALVVGSFILSSCSSKFSLTKRRYSKGYHLEVAANPAAKTNNQANGVWTPPEKTSHQTLIGAGQDKTVESNPSSGSLAEAPLVKQSKPQTLATAQTKNTVKTSRYLGYKRIGFDSEPNRPGKNSVKNQGLYSDTEKADPVNGWGSGLGSGGATLIYGLGSLVSIFFFFFYLYIIFGGAFSIGPSFFVIVGVVLVIALVIGILYLINAD